MYKVAAQPAMWWRRPAPDPGFRPGVELCGGQRRSDLDLGRVGEGLPGQGGPGVETPPALLQVEPGGTDRDEDVGHARVVFQPGALAALWWEERLSVTTTIFPPGFACSTACRNRW
jgi:hypothetical protein